MAALAVAAADGGAVAGGEVAGGLLLPAHQQAAAAGGPAVRPHPAARGLAGGVTWGRQGPVGAGLAVRLAYYPPYHSKDNPVERCWGLLEQHWNGTLLDALDTALQFAATMTWKGARPTVTLVTTAYERGVALTKEAMGGGGGPPHPASYPRPSTSPPPERESSFHARPELPIARQYAGSGSSSSTDEGNCAMSPPGGGHITSRTISFGSAKKKARMPIPSVLIGVR